MPDSISSLLLWVFALLVMAGVLITSIILARKPSDKMLIGLSLGACLAAFGFVPLLRALPEPISLRFFFVTFWPTLALIAIAVIASTVRFIQTRKKESLPALLLSILAVGLYYINSTTEWIWPYKVY
jgi:uncharacterized membrane protein (UPF0136 family)